MSDAPKCPKVERLKALIDFIREDDLNQWDADQEVEVVNALEWLLTQLENRSLYHKKQNLKKKIVFDLAREHGLLDQAEKLTGDALFEHVANQEGDND